MATSTIPSRQQLVETLRALDHAGSAVHAVTGGIRSHMAADDPLPYDATFEEIGVMHVFLHDARFRIDEMQSYLADALTDLGYIARDLGASA